MSVKLLETSIFEATMIKLKNFIVIVKETALVNTRLVQGGS